VTPKPTQTASNVTRKRPIAPEEQTVPPAPEN
jgi:hypothetical protein